ncbi:hypothetical protein EB796_016125 [Bugula neritina]|uniref:Uncharacterized protein n=1 Tax=Bugula neritina TaxID=10212 RepID=A0A7J7JID2_BUGNE|nr:hypothetical protein EB796_016125 [Bugula neritina]
MALQEQRLRSADFVQCWVNSIPSGREEPSCQLSLRIVTHPPTQKAVAQLPLHAALTGWLGVAVRVLEVCLELLTHQVAHFQLKSHSRI